MLLDLLDHVADLSRGAPILLLCTARPELLDDRPAWSGGKLNATTVLLEPLNAADSEMLLDRLGNDLAPEARARVVAASEGNPLFLEEMVALARERGTVEVPATIQALLAARIERLATEERELLERGAVEGEVFHYKAVGALADEPIAAQLDSALASLVRKELIRPHPPTFEGDLAFRFRHMLIRDAAYDSLPKATRALLHERFASWLEQNARHLAQLDEIAGSHLQQTVRYQHEVGRTVDPALARRAAEHLHTAGRRASERNDPAAARKLLESAYALASEDSAIRARVAVDLAEELIETGELTRADELLSLVERDPGASMLAALIRLQWLMSAQPQHAIQTIESTLPGILERLSQAGDERGLAKAHLVAFEMDWLPGRGTSAAEHALLAAQHARNAGDEGLRSQALAWYVTSLAWGPQDIQTIDEKLDAIDREAPGPYLAGRIIGTRGLLERHRGCLQEARQLVQNAIDIQLALGLRVNAAQGQTALAELELSDQNAAAALNLLLKGDAILAEMGEQAYRSTTQANLARVYERLGDLDAAYTAIARSDQLGSADDLLNHPITHAVRGRLALAKGDNRTAERWARSAVEQACRTEWPMVQGDARLELARILAALHRPAEATSEAHIALELYEAKGDRPGAAEARALLDNLAGDA